MIELIKFAGVSAIALVAVGTFRLALDMILNGEGRIREVREEGGGMSEKIRGELRDEHGRPSSARARGLYITVETDGEIRYEPKSMMAREVA